MSTRAGPLQVRKVAEENGVDVSESIRELEDRAKQVGSLTCSNMGAAAWPLYSLPILILKVN